MTEKDYDSIGKRYIGSEYGDMRRERAELLKQLVHGNEESVKPRIREITLQMQEHIKGGTRSGRTSAKNPATSNYPKTK
jgi:hypothetical protein